LEVEPARTYNVSIVMHDCKVAKGSINQALPSTFLNVKGMHSKTRSFNNLR
jgi:hypothetical protein